MPRTGDDNESALRQAMALIIEAMDLLDAYQGPPEATAHLSLARERLRQAVLDLRK